MNYESLEAVQVELERVERQAQERGERLGAPSAKLEEQRATAGFEDEPVWVTVDGSGMPHELGIFADSMDRAHECSRRAVARREIAG